MAIPTVLLCLLVISINTQPKIITKETSEYILKVESFGINLHVEVLYQVQAGIRRCQRIVDEQYNQQHLPFIINLEMLFVIFESEKDYKIKNQGEVIELYTYQTAGGRTYSQKSEITLEEKQVVKGKLKKTTNLSQEIKEEIKSELRQELMQEMKKEVVFRMKEQKQNANTELSQLRQKVKNLQSQIDDLINQKLNTIKNQIKVIRNSFFLLQGQFLSEFGKIEKMVSDLKAVVEENKKKIEDKLKKIEGQQGSSSFDPNKVEGRVTQNERLISTTQQEISSIKKQIESILESVEEHEKEINILTQKNVYLQTKIEFEQQSTSIQQSTSKRSEDHFWQTSFQYGNHFRVSGGIAEYTGQNGKRAISVSNFLLFSLIYPLQKQV